MFSHRSLEASSHGPWLPGGPSHLSHPLASPVYKPTSEVVSSILSNDFFCRLPSPGNCTHCLPRSFAQTLGRELSRHFLHCQSKKRRELSACSAFECNVVGGDACRAPSPGVETEVQFMIWGFLFLLLYFAFQMFKKLLWSPLIR